MPALFPVLLKVPSFMLVVFALGFFTSSRISEQVRAGILTLPQGQRYAGLAMGLTLPQTYRYVLLPMAYRIIIPPLTSEGDEHLQEHLGGVRGEHRRADDVRAAVVGRDVAASRRSSSR